MPSVMLFTKLFELVAVGMLSKVAGVLDPVEIEFVRAVVVERVAVDVGHSPLVAALHTTSPFAKTDSPAE